MALGCGPRSPEECRPALGPAGVSGVVLDDGQLALSGRPVTVRAQLRVAACARAEQLQVRAEVHDSANVLVASEVVEAPVSDGLVRPVVRFTPSHGGNHHLKVFVEPNVGLAQGTKVVAEDRLAREGRALEVPSSPRCTRVQAHAEGVVSCITADAGSWLFRDGGTLGVVAPDETFVVTPQGVWAPQGTQLAFRAFVDDGVLATVPASARPWPGFTAWPDGTARLLALDGGAVVVVSGELLRRFEVVSGQPRELGPPSPGFPQAHVVELAGGRLFGLDERRLCVRELPPSDAGACVARVSFGVGVTSEGIFTQRSGQLSFLTAPQGLTVDAGLTTTVVPVPATWTVVPPGAFGPPGVPKLLAKLEPSARTAEVALVPRATLGEVVLEAYAQPEGSSLGADQARVYRIDRDGGLWVFER